MWKIKKKTKIALMEITNQIESWFDCDLALPNDPIGIQLNNTKLISKILIALDTTKEVVEYAIKNKIDLIINHHPFIYQELTTELLNPIKNKLIKNLNKHKITVYSCHTNYDAANNGMNNYLAKKLQLENIKINTKNLICYANLKKTITFNQFIQIIKTKLALKNVLFAGNLNDNIKNVALLAGSGSDVITSLNNVDLFITGEIKWHDWLQADQQNLNVLALGHYIENIFVEHLAQLLKTQFSKLEIITYNIKNPIQFQ